MEILRAVELCGIKIKRTGREEYLAYCPFCDDKKGHLYLNIVKDSYRCARCGQGGFAVGLVSRMLNIDKSEAARRLNEMCGQIIKRNEIYYRALPDKNDFIADIDIRDRVYRILISNLSINSEHTKNLCNRGLNLDVIKKKGYRSLPNDGNSRVKICQRILETGLSLEGVPGFYKGTNGWNFYYTAGFIIPVKDSKGRIQGLQIRRDNATEKKYVWFSAVKYGGTGSKSFIHVAKGDKFPDTVAITEGPLKADIASMFSGITFIAVPGVSNWKGIFDVLSELTGIKNIIIAYDMDAYRNEIVMMHRRQLESELKKHGYNVRIGNWNRNIKGIDEYLYSCYKKRA